MNDKTKIIVAVLCLGLAALAIVWRMGVFSSGPEGARNTENADQTLEDARRNADDVQNIGGATIIPPSEGNPRSGVITN